MLVAVLVTAVCGVIVGALIWPMDEDLAGIVGSVIAPLLWLVAATVIGRETAPERAQRLHPAIAVVCPTCGYNLSGLSEARCPECGSRFTLDELLGAQPGRAVTEIERTA
jgi:hypothetical protein